MRNRRDYRRDFDENEHPRDARGRFVDEDEAEGYGYERGYSRGSYGQNQYAGGRYGGTYRREGGGRFGDRGLTPRGGWNERDYGGSESGYGYPEEDRRFSGGWRGLGGAGESEEYRGLGKDASGYQYGLGGRGMRDEDDEGLSDYHHWRGEQMKKFDSDYDEWCKERRKKFSEDFDKWRSSRSGSGQAEQAPKK